MIWHGLCFFVAFTSNSNFVILIERVKSISNIAAKYILVHYGISPWKFSKIARNQLFHLANCLNLRDPKLWESRMDSQSLTMSSIDVKINFIGFWNSKPTSIVFSCCYTIINGLAVHHEAKDVVCLQAFVSILSNLTEGSNFDHKRCFISWFSISDSRSSQSNQILLQIQIQNLSSQIFRKNMCCQTKIVTVMRIACILLHMCFFKGKPGMLRFLPCEKTEPSTYNRRVWLYKVSSARSPFHNDRGWGTQKSGERVHHRNGKGRSSTQKYQTGGFLSSQVFQCGDVSYL